MSIIVGNLTSAVRENARQVDEEDDRIRTQMRRKAQTHRVAEQAQARQRFEQRLQQAQHAGREPLFTLPAGGGEPSPIARKRPQEAPLPAAGPGEAGTAGTAKAAGTVATAGTAGTSGTSGTSGTAGTGEANEPDRFIGQGHAPVRGELGPRDHATVRIREAGRVPEAPISSGSPVTPPGARSLREGSAAERVQPPSNRDPVSEPKQPGSAQADAQGLTDAPLSRQLAELARAVAGQGASLQSEQLLARLQALSGRVDSACVGADSHEERARAKACLEFLAGYFETERGDQGPGRKICAAVHSLQEQMAQVEQGLQIAAGGPAAVALSQVNAAVAVRPMQLSGQAMSSEKARARKQEEGRPTVLSGDDQTMQASLARGSLPPPSTEVPAGHRSGLSRDIDKRRGETLPEVSVRSV